MRAQQETHTEIPGDLFSLLLPERSPDGRSVRGSESSEAVGSGLPHNVESLWRTRLSRISQPELKRIKATNFHASRADPSTLNEAMSIALDTKNPISMVCAWVRCQLLRSPVAAYAGFVGLGEHAIRDIERIELDQPSKRERETYSKLLQAWAKLAHQHTSSDPCLSNQLTEAREELLNSLPGADSSSTFGLLVRWRHEVGAAAFQSLPGLSYQNLWTRRKQGALYEFHELKRIGEVLGILTRDASSTILQEASGFKALENAWLNDCSKLDRPLSISRLHVLLALADVRPLSLTLHTHPEIKLLARASTRIAAFKEVTWEDVAPAISFLRSKNILVEGGALELNLQSQFITDAKHIEHTFEERLQALAEQQSIDNAMLADIFDLRSPDRQKAALPIFRALRYGEYSREVPAGVMALVLASDNAEAATLLGLKRQEIAESLLRRERFVSPLCIERQLWRVGYLELPFEKGEIQALEWGKKSNLDEKDAVKEALRIGLAKAHPVLMRWQALHDRSSIQASFTTSLYYSTQHDFQSELQSSARRIKSIAIGGEVPPLPTIRRFLVNGSEPLPHQLERDWYDSFAKFQAGINQSDLERLISTYIASKSETVKDYLVSRGLPKHAWPRIISALSTSGTLSHKDFETLAGFLAVGHDSPWYKLASLVRNIGTITEALPNFVSQLKAENDLQALQRLRALKRVYSLDSKERDRRKHGNVSLSELLDIRQGKVPERAPHRDEESAMACLRELSGLTAQEVQSIELQASKIEGNRVRLMRTLLDRAADRGISEKELAFALEKTVPVNRHAFRQASQALATLLGSPITAPGVLAYLVSEDEVQLRKWLTECRREAREALHATGIKPTPLQIEMRVWGVRRDDINMPRHDLGEVLWNADPKSDRAQELLQKISETGATKAANALERLLSKRRAVLVPDVVGSFLQMHPSGARGVTLDAGVKVNAPTQFASGEAVPSVDQFHKMAQSCGFDLKPIHLIGHHFALAEQVAGLAVTPLSRCMAHLGFLAPPHEASQVKKSAVERAYINLLAAVGLDLPRNRRLLLKANLERIEYWDLCKQILRTMGHTETSPLYDFALCLYVSDSTSSALKRWGSGTVGLIEKFPDLRPLCSLCEQMIDDPVVSESGVSLSELLQHKEASLSVNSEGDAIEGLAKTTAFLPGVRISDLIDVPEDAHYPKIFEHLRERAADLQPFMPKPISRYGSPTPRLLALIAREQDEESAANERRAQAESERAKGREDRLLIDFRVAVGRPRDTCPTVQDIQAWADTLSSIMHAPKVAMLPRMYPSLRLAVGEAVGRGLSYEEAFVRKAVELFDRAEERKRLREREEG